MSNCCVPNCKGKGGHHFPRSSELKRKWIVAVKRLGKGYRLWHPSPSSRVCRRHFRAEDYTTTLLGERHILKKGVVPSQHINRPSASRSALARRRRALRRNGNSGSQEIIDDGEGHKARNAENACVTYGSDASMTVVDSCSKPFNSSSTDRRDELLLLNLNGGIRDIINIKLENDSVEDAMDSDSTLIQNPTTFEKGSGIPCVEDTSISCRNSLRQWAKEVVAEHTGWFVLVCPKFVTMNVVGIREDEGAPFVRASVVVGNSMNVDVFLRGVRVTHLPEIQRVLGGGPLRSRDQLQALVASLAGDPPPVLETGNRMLAQVDALHACVQECAQVNGPTVATKTKSALALLTQLRVQVKNISKAVTEIELESLLGRKNINKSVERIKVVKANAHSDKTSASVQGYKRKVSPGQWDNLKGKAVENRVSSNGKGLDSASYTFRRLALGNMAFSKDNFPAVNSRDSSKQKAVKSMDSPKVKVLTVNPDSLKRSMDSPKVKVVTVNPDSLKQKPVKSIVSPKVKVLTVNPDSLKQKAVKSIVSPKVKVLTVNPESLRQKYVESIASPKVRVLTVNPDSLKRSMVLPKVKVLTVNPESLKKKAVAKTCAVNSL